MLFESRFWPGIAEGSITLTFRRWKRPQVLAGKTYRTAAGRLVVDSIDAVEAAAITDGEAERSGYPNAETLRADLRGDASLSVYRIAFRRALGDDPREVLAASGRLSAEERTSLRERLDRLDSASPVGPWTAKTLQLINDHPAVRAGDLAPSLGQELLVFKRNVRKLKELGLTLSLETGYRLSPRGEAFFAQDATAGGTD